MDWIADSFSKNMSTKFPNLLLVRTAATELDHQGRICGKLDVPLCEAGMAQARETARELADRKIKVIYRAPCMAASQTAELLAAKWNVRIKIETALENVDFGLWHGRKLLELKNKQPKLFRSWTDHPEMICPPGGEAICHVQKRIRDFLKFAGKKHDATTIAIVVSAPVAAVIKNEYHGGELGELWCNLKADAAWLDLRMTDSVLVN
jgi:broad specificity phosphatase PhoE